MSNNDGGPAFPRAPLGEDCERPYGHQDGMSLRDYFAGQALAGLLAHGPHESLKSLPDGMLTELTVGAAFDFADAMLAARNSTQPNGEPK